MPDYPYVYGAPASPPVDPGGTRYRLGRRRPRRDGRAGEDAGDRGGDDERHEAWRSLLGDAVDALNRSMGASGRPHRFALEEDAGEFWLRVVLPEGSGVEERLDPAELDRWLARLRAQVGVVLDREA